MNLFELMEIKDVDQEDIKELVPIINSEGEKYGLILSYEDVYRIAEGRKEVLSGYGRVDIDMSVAEKLTKSFCSSVFVTQDNYTDTIIQLQEIFYYIKNETEGTIGDDELIRKMKEVYEKESEGSIMLLSSKLEEYAAMIRFGLMEEDI